MNVSPALLSTAVLGEVQRRLEAVGGRPWMEVLLTSYCDWTEYTLYLLAAERADAVNRYHLWTDDPQAPAHLQTDPALSVWDACQRVAGERRAGCSPGRQLPGSSRWSQSAAPACEVAAPIEPLSPVAPHWMFPGFQFLPVSARSYLAPRWPLGHTYGWSRVPRPTRSCRPSSCPPRRCAGTSAEAEIVWERIAGVPKSMTAIKHVHAVDPAR